MKRLMMVFVILISMLSPQPILAETGNPIKFKQTSYELETGTKAQLEYTLEGLGEPVKVERSYSTSNNDVVAISDTGLMTARNQGNAEVTVTIVADGSVYSNSIAVRVTLPVYTITFSEREIYVEQGTTYDLKYTVSDNAKNQLISWNSNNPGVASVENGRVHANRPGDAIISGRVGNAEATLQVHVSVPLEQLSFNPNTLRIAIGERLTIPELIYVPYNATLFHDPVYTVDDPTIVTLEGRELIAQKIGKTKLHVSVDDVKATLDIEVAYRKTDENAIILDFKEVDKNLETKRLTLGLPEIDVALTDRLFLNIDAALLQDMLALDEFDVFLELGKFKLNQVETIFLPKAVVKALGGKKSRFHILDRNKIDMLYYELQHGMDSDLDLNYKLRMIGTDSPFVQRIDGYAYQIVFSDRYRFPEGTQVSLNANALNSTPGQLHFIYDVEHANALSDASQEVRVQGDERIQFEISSSDMMITFNRVMRNNDRAILITLSLMVVAMLGGIGFYYFKRYQKRKKL